MQIIKYHVIRTSPEYTVYITKYTVNILPSSDTYKWKKSARTKMIIFHVLQLKKIIRLWVTISIYDILVSYCDKGFIISG